MKIEKPRTGISTLGATGIIVLAGVIFAEVNPWWLILSVFCILSAIANEAGKGGQMPYIEKTGNKAIAEQLWQWEGVMHDPNIDGFNGWGCKQKIYKVLWQAQEAIDKAPKYSGEEEWLQERKDEVAFKKLAGER